MRNGVCQKSSCPIQRVLISSFLVLLFAATNLPAQISGSIQISGGPSALQHLSQIAVPHAGSNPAAVSSSSHVPPGMSKLHHSPVAHSNVLKPAVAQGAIFNSTPTYPSGGLQPNASAVGDVNGDGIPDLLVINECASNSSCGGSVGVLLGNGDGTFQAAVVYATSGADSTSIAVADVNGDGHLDILVANQCASGSNCNSSSVDVLLGNGDGTFQAAVPYADTGTDPYSVAVADVNGDGKADLLLANQCASNSNCNNGSVSVLLGNGDGTFQAAVSYGSGGSNAFSVTAADVNGDGHLDLLVSNDCSSNNNCGYGTVGVLLGNGDGTFQSAVSYSSGGYYSRSVAVGDMNGDGKPDLVVSNQCANNNVCWAGSVSVLLGNGDGTFQAATSYLSGAPTTLWAVIADVNGDGKQDVIVSNQCDFSANCGTGVISVLLGNGDGTLQAAVPYSSGADQGISVVVKDVNGDGKLDILATNQCSDNYCDGGSVGVLLGNGDGTFQAPRSYNPGGVSTFAVAAADMNGDGKQDLLVTNQCDTNVNCNNGSVGVLLGNGDGTFSSAVTYGSGGSSPLAMTVADVNGDGKPDVLVANQCSGNSCTGTVGVLLGNGDGTLQAATTYSSLALYAIAVAVADVNGDGKPDLLVANQCNSSNNCDNGTVTVLLGNGDGTFQTGVVYNSGGSSALGLAVADVNGDGMPDLLVINQCLNNNSCNNGTAAVLLGNGDGTFQPAVTYSTGALYASAVAVGDVNGDGKPDLLVTNQCVNSSNCSDGAVSVLLGNGDGTFQTASTIEIPTPQYFSQIVLGDFNGDGYLDLASGVGDFLLLGNGDGTFQPYLSLGGGGQGIAAADFNGDGRPDLASGGVTVLLNVASGYRFTTASSVTASANPANGFVSFTATVSPSFNGGPVSGDVVFYDGATSLGSATIGSNNQAVLSNVSLTLGAHSMTAAYGGSSSYLPSTSPILSETENQWGTTTALSSSQNPVTVNQSVMFTATVTASGGATATGSVAFMDGATTLATVTLSNGSATYATSSLALGSHSITAVYGGASIDSASTSSVVAQVVNVLQPASTATSLAASSNSASLTLTATVSPASSGLSGTVSFIDGTTLLGSSSVNASGVATLSTSGLTAGVHNITAAYAGNANYNGSASSVMAVTADFALSASTASPASLTPGQTSTSTITVTPKNGFNPSGVTFTCSIAPTASPAPTCTVSAVTVASDTGTATLTVSTVASTALLGHPAGKDSRAMLVFALLIPGLLIGTAGVVKQDRSKLLGLLLALVVLAGCGLQSACGGNPKTTTTTSGGTQAGSYTVTVTGSANSTQHTSTVSVTIN